MWLLEVDPNAVTAGWVPMVIVLVLLVALAGFFVSMQRHVRRGAEIVPTRQEALAARRQAADAAEPGAE